MGSQDECPDEAARAAIVLVCSPGGHLLQLLALQPAWEAFRPTWVTLEAADVGHLLAGQEVVLGWGPTNRSLPNFLRNLSVAWRTLRRSDAETVLSTGAGLAVPFFLVGKLLGRRLVYVESLTRIEALSLSGRLVRPLADEFFVQWPSLARGRTVRYEGGIL